MWCFLLIHITDPWGCVYSFSVINNWKAEQSINSRIMEVSHLNNMFCFPLRCNQRRQPQSDRRLAGQKVVEWPETLHVLRDLLHLRPERGESLPGWWARCPKSRLPEVGIDSVGYCASAQALEHSSKGKLFFCSHPKLESNRHLNEHWNLLNVHYGI